MDHATILGCRVDAVGTDDAVSRIVALAHGSEPSLVVTLGTEMVVCAQSDAQFREAVNASALSLCDTVGVLLAARLQGKPLPGRVAGVEMLEPLCAALARERLPVYFLGAKGDTAAHAANALAARHPGLRIAGARDGYFGQSDDAQIAQTIRDSGARVLLAGLGSPRQELWLSRWLGPSGCGVGIGVGGSFDVLAGNVARAPQVWRRLNLEWLYRLVREPSRWRRQLALPKFVVLALFERATGRPGSTA
jgi:N-acetylglucosaminyldiphosphoundecaprenol N-acetyl-beta-D-mannosaminyltransferase